MLNTFGPVARLAESSTSPPPKKNRLRTFNAPTTPFTICTYIYVVHEYNITHNVRIKHSFTHEHQNIRLGNAQLRATTLR